MGVDSTALLVGYRRRGIRPDVTLFADVGAEKPETYAYLAIIQAWCARVGFPPVVVVKRKSTTNKRGTYATIEENMLVNATMPSLVFGGRKCSQKWKHEVQDRWVRAHFAPARECWARGELVEKAIGFDATERRKAVVSDTEYRYTYPLRDWGMSRADCVALIEDEGLPVPPKSACFFCPSMKTDEVDVLSHDLLRRIVRLEANAEPRQLARIAEGKSAAAGLWRRPTLGRRGATAKPGSMTEYIVGEELLPEFRGQTMVDPWWRTKAPPSNGDFHCAQAAERLRTPPLSGHERTDTDECEEETELQGAAHDARARAPQRSRKAAQRRAAQQSDAGRCCRQL
jgi:hypothetical protein